MTFCLGMLLGNECRVAKKTWVHQRGRASLFVMTSGLRSVRDRVLMYFEELAEQQEAPFERLFKAVNAFAGQVRRAAGEDRKALEEAGLRFNLHALIGGQGEADREHELYLVYPEGNWVRVGRLAFDSSRICAADVDYPSDVLLYARDTFRIVEHRTTQQDFREVSAWWQERMRKSVNELPAEPIERAFARLSQPAQAWT